MYINLKKLTLCTDGYPELQMEAPCSMYSVLLEKNLIDNPFLVTTRRK